MRYLKTLCFDGINFKIVEVQVNIIPGYPSLNIVGLPDKAVNEAKDRILSSLQSIGFSLPSKKIIINLAPADLPKNGSYFDLPIALSILRALEVIKSDEVFDYLFLGELSLHGKLLYSTCSILSCVCCLKNNLNLMISKDNLPEIKNFINLIKVFTPSDIFEILNHFNQSNVMNSILKYEEKDKNESIEKQIDMSDVKGQFSAKRAIEIGVSGGHNVLMIGPPGSGKSMIAERIPTISPNLSNKDSIEKHMIHSIAGINHEDSFSNRIPFRSPHHSSSAVSLIGGTKKLTPGEITLAHNGVLFLDELPEFPRHALDSLRQPMESGKVNISRATGTVEYPSKFQLIGAMNPCKCGYFGDKKKQCSKAPLCVKDYQKKISGPILDRIDITVDVEYNYDSIFSKSDEKNETSREIKKRVTNVRDIQVKRYKNLGIELNGQASIDILMKVGNFPKDLIQFAQDLTKKFSISIRAYTRILRLARTISDMEGEEIVNKNHIIEAMSYRGFNL